MSRSYKKYPITGWTTSTSEKKDKRIANKRHRLAVKAAIKNGRYEFLPKKKEVSNVWDFSKDGKQWWDNPKAVRK